MARIVIIIPTYNERENTGAMIEALADVIEWIKDDAVLVLYVDSNSPDKTADIVREKQKTYSWLHLLVEEKKSGLGGAYALGMRHAMKFLNADYFIEFDSDFQHPPEKLVDLIAETKNGYDYVVASRYVKGGGVSGEWGFKRRLISRCGNLLARMMLGMWSVKDVTGGFKLSRVEGFMDRFDFGSLISRSFAYKIQLYYYMFKRGARIKEVPFIFQPRKQGESKIPKGEIKETLRVLFKLRAKSF